MQHKRNGHNKSYGPQVQRQEYRKREGGYDKGKGKATDEVNSNTHQDSSSGNTGDGTSQNRCEVSSNEAIEEGCEVKSLKDKLVVDDFWNKKVQPTCAELKSWTKDMEDYFKRQWEIDRIKDQENKKDNGEEVMEGRNAMAQTMANDNVIGLSSNVLH